MDERLRADRRAAATGDREAAERVAGAVARLVPPAPEPEPNAGPDPVLAKLTALRSVVCEMVAKRGLVIDWNRVRMSAREDLVTRCLVVRATWPDGDGILGFETSFSRVELEVHLPVALRRDVARLLEWTKERELGQVTGPDLCGTLWCGQRRRHAGPCGRDVGSRGRAL